MKPLLIVLVLLVGVLAYTMLRPAPANPPAAGAPARNIPTWDQPVPEGAELLPDGDAVVKVTHTRRNDHGQAILDFELSEEHGYMVDGINVEYWYRGKVATPAPGADASGAAAAESPRVVHFVAERLGSGQKLKVSTVMVDLEFRDLKINLQDTTTEDWDARVLNYTRAMRQK